MQKMSSLRRYRLLRRALPAWTNVHWLSTDALPGATASASIPAAAATTDTTTAAKKEQSSSAWTLIKGTLYLATTASAAACAYLSYAYTSDEIEKRVSTLGASSSIKSTEDFDLPERIRGSVASTFGSATRVFLENYLDVRKSVEDQVRGFSAPSSSKLLPDLQPQEQHVYTLVLDLNETLVYSDWKRDRGWRTFKRPGVEPFLEQLAQYYEIVIYSDQLSFYVDPILDRLDQKGCIRFRLSRDATQYINGKHMRDLSKLNRDPSRVIYLSGHAAETTLNPENALTIKPWKLEGDDTGLLDLLPFLEYVARNRPADIRAVLASYQGQDIASEFRMRHQEYQRRMQERKQQSRFWRGSAISR